MGNPKPARIAKLTLPNTTGLFARERLFALLDQARCQPAVWISGPAGAGKTSLLASYLELRKLSYLWYQVDAGDADPATFFHYLGRAAKAAASRKRPLPNLTPECLPSLETFVRRFFRSLFERFEPPFVLVLDNLQEAVASLLPQVLAHALSEVPPGISMLLLSRQTPPPPLARWYANSPVIGWDDLKLTKEEAMAFALQRSCLDSAALQPLIEKAQGWAAGLVLLVRAQAEGGAPLLVEKPSLQALYEYFAQEVFATIPPETQAILLKTALLPEVTAEAARQLTGSRRAPEVLVEWHRHRFFIDRHHCSATVYVYHPLFRDFLLERARELYPPSRLARLKRKAALILEQSGQIEAAVELLTQAEAWDEAARLIVKQAPALIEQGRNAVLEHWIAGLPASCCNENP